MAENKFTVDVLREAKQEFIDNYINKEPYKSKLKLTGVGIGKDSIQVRHQIKPPMNLFFPEKLPSGVPVEYEYIGKIKIMPAKQYVCWSYLTNLVTTVFSSSSKPQLRKILINAINECIDDLSDADIDACLESIRDKSILPEDTAVFKEVMDKHCPGWRELKEHTSDNK